MFIHHASRKLLLDAPEPGVILGSMPAIEVPGEGFNVAVKHTSQAVLKLRELGINAPSPIMSYYDWPLFKGVHEPFDHQRSMAEFMTLHPRCFNFGEMGCVSADTEYLSETGWKRIDGYVDGKVAQYHPTTGTIEFVDPSEYVKLPCRDMVRFKTTRGVDQLLSPEHRVLWADGTVEQAADIALTYGIARQRNKFITTFDVGERLGLPLTDAEIRLQVAVNADAWVPNRDRAYVRVKKTRKIERLRLLLAATGTVHTERPCLPEGFVKFTFRPPTTKGFDASWYAASAAQLAIVADECVHWDGDKRKAGGVGFTGTKRDCDLVQFTFAATGRRASMARDKRSPDVWKVHASAGDPTIGLYGANTQHQNVSVEPSTDGFKYCFMVPSTFLVTRRNGCIVATGNTGKTCSTLWALDFLMNEGRAKKALILSPLSTLEQVWLIGVAETIMHRSAVVLHGSREKRLKLLAENHNIYIINHDGINIGPVCDTIMKDPAFTHFIVDEGSKFRNAKTDRYRNLERLVSRPGVALWWLTGTPCPKGPDNAWAQARLVNPSNVPKFFGQFRAQVMVEINEHKWVKRSGSDEIAWAAMQPAIRIIKDECLDLPPMTVQTLETRLTSGQTTMYDAMRKAMIAASDSGEVVTAVNAADRLNKLRQILLGSVKTGPNEYTTLDYSTRFNDLLEAIDMAQAKVLIVAPFKGIQRDLSAKLTALAEKQGDVRYTNAVVNGDVSQTKRNAIFRDFKSMAAPHTLICHPEVMSHGLNLTEADVLVFFGPMFSNDMYRQVVERINRPGQTRKMTVIRIGCNAIEWQIYNSLDTDEEGQQSILELYKNVAKGSVH